MNNLFDFLPDPDRASYLDARNHRGLVDSLRHVLDEASNLDGLNVEGIRALIDSVETGDRYGPVAFGRYYDLIFALLANRYDDAVATSSGFSGLKPTNEKLLISDLADSAVDDEAGLIRRLVGPDAEARYLPPAPASTDMFRGRLQAAIALAEQQLPEFAHEFHALTKQIALAAEPAGTKNQFSSTSVFTLWGLILMNPLIQQNPVFLVQVLTHEAGHLLLFGLTFDEALVLNDEANRFASPLRPDQRPMDGVFHATFVAARMHWSTSRLAACTALDTAARDEAAFYAEHAAGRFKKGFDVVAEHADMTETGKAIMSATYDYMQRAA